MKIGILGGGIGGLSTAIALKQKGFDVDVYERHSRPVEIGAGIVCWPNAAFVLEQLGVLDNVAAVSGSLMYMNRFTSEGELLGSLDIKKLSQLMEYPSYAVLRKDLMYILTQRTVELGINLYYQHAVTGISDGESGEIGVQFSNGKKIEPDIIIGADGRMNSFARKYVHGDNIPLYQGFINWIGVVEFKSEMFTELSVSDYWGIGERFGVVPISNKIAYWAGGVASEDIGEAIPELYKSELNSYFAGWPDFISEIIKETPVSRINKIYVHDHDPLNSWHKNNVVLLGDAAHASLPTSGQGACQALEDAWQLANCLSKDIDDIPKYFSRFTELRASKTAGITMGGRRLAASLFNQDRDYCRQRNLAAKNTDYKVAVAGMAKGWASGLPIRS